MITPVPNEERCKRLTDLLVTTAQYAGYSDVEFGVVVAALYQAALQGGMGDHVHEAVEMMDRCMKASAS